MRLRLTASLIATSQLCFNCYTPGGTLGQPCIEDHACFGDQVCVDQVCVPAGNTGNSGTSHSSSAAESEATSNFHDDTRGSAESEHPTSTGGADSAPSDNTGSTSDDSGPDPIAEKHWTEPFLADNQDDYNAWLAGVHMPANGDARVLWRTESTYVRDVHMTVYSYSFEDWTTPILVEGSLSYEPGWAAIAGDDNGDTLVVWEAWHGSETHIWANHYTSDASQWDVASLIDNSGPVTNSTQVSTSWDSNSGVAFAAWRQSTGDDNQIWTRKYDTESAAWIGEPERIDGGPIGNTDGVRLIVHSTGETIAVWRKNDGVRYNLWANRYHNGQWGDAEIVAAPPSGDVYGISLSSNKQGSTTVVWSVEENFDERIWSSRFEGGAWTLPFLLDDGGSPSIGRSAVLANGDAIGAWRASVGASTYRILVKWYDHATSDWTSSEQLPHDGDDVIMNMQLASLGNNSAVVVWADGNGDVWSTRHIPSTSQWTTPEILSLIDGQYVGMMFIDSNSNGDVVASWQKFENPPSPPPYAVWASILRD